ncbi:UNVERIFIED_CONTAM: DNA-binding CsgD family transcriptional regulator [Brevibacillus sp. OAP136]
MDNLPDLFWSASLEEMKRGYRFDGESESFICLICGSDFEQGVIYPHEGKLYEAEKYVRLHVEQEHESMFAHLLELDKKVTGLTDLQKQLLRHFYAGTSDNDIVKETGGSTSTIRNHRFSLREKAKQAKVFLALMDLLEQRPVKQTKLISNHRDATMLDERYAITEEESEAILRTYFPDGLDGMMTEFPKKEKRKVVIMRHVIKRFDPKQTYTENEVNEILGTAYSDHVTLRRYLVDYGFMNRKADGSSYWVNQNEYEEKESNKMERQSRKDAIRAYKEELKPMGIYQIYNKRDGKALIAGSMNLPAIFNRQRFTLKLGSHTDKALQQDWNDAGEEQFSFDILQQLEPKENETATPDVLKQYQEKLTELESIWRLELQNTEEPGYRETKARKQT